MNFRTRTTRTLRAHFPKVVFFSCPNNALFRHPFEPQVKRFFIRRNPIFVVPFKNSNVQTIFVHFVHLCQQFPSPSNCFFFKIVSKRPVPQHFKHRLVITVSTDVFQIIVFPRHSQTLLSICNTGGRRSFVSKEIIFELCHS